MLVRLNILPEWSEPLTQADTLQGALCWGNQAGTKYLRFEELSWLHLVCALHLSSHIQRLSFHYYDLYYVEPRPTYLLTSRTISRTTTFRSPMVHYVLFLTGLLNTRYFDNRGLPWSVALSVYVHHILIVQTIERLSARRLFSCMTRHYVWHTVQHVLYPLALSLNWMSRTVTMSYDNWLSAYYVNKFIKTSRNSSNKPLPLAVGSSIMIRQLGEFCRVSGVIEREKFPYICSDPTTGC